MMLSDVIGAKTGLIACRGDFQSVAVLLTKTSARMVQMIKNAKTEGRRSCTIHSSVPSAQLLIPVGDDHRSAPFSEIWPTPLQAPAPGVCWLSIVLFFKFHDRMHINVASADYRDISIPKGRVTSVTPRPFAFGAQN